MLIFRIYLKVSSRVYFFWSLCPRCQVIFLVGFPNHGTQATWIDPGDGDGVMIRNEEDDVLERLMDTTPVEV